MLKCFACIKTKEDALRAYETQGQKGISENPQGLSRLSSFDYLQRFFFVVKKNTS
jgi:hypothetical protein